MFLQILAVYCLLGQVAPFNSIFHRTGNFHGSHFSRFITQIPATSAPASILTTTSTSWNDFDYKSYIWKHDYKISYVTFGDEAKPPLLLLPGFGVGAFHYERNIPELAKDYHVFSLDLLGQGSSWRPSIK